MATRPSWQARATVAVLRIVPQSYFDGLFTKPARRGDKPLVPAKIAKAYEVDEYTVLKGRVATIAPSARAGHIFFLHGGGYTMEDQHWGFLGMLLEADYAISLIDYPLAPEHTVDDTIPMVLDAWDEVIKRSATHEVSVLGDSAGGGLALVLLQQLRDMGRHVPRQTVLLSPWVDIEMTDDETAAYAKVDPLLSLNAVGTTAGWYAGGLPLDDPRLSPIHGSMDNIGSIRMYAGTRELLLPQIKRLAKKLRSAKGTDLRFTIHDGLIHDWALFDYLPETRALVEDVVAWLSSDTRSAENRATP